MMFPAIQDNIKIAKNTLLNGEPIIYPTDTLYSFGALATDSKTIRLINDIKRRTSPLSIVVSKVKEINTYAHIKKKYNLTINDILPGKYTILLKAKKHNLSKLIQNNSKLIGIRIPNHEFTIKLVENLLGPIITTSVNIHGHKPLIDIYDIKKAYPMIKIFYDKKRLNSKGSTILDLSQDSINIVRIGDAKIIQ